MPTIEQFNRRPTASRCDQVSLADFPAADRFIRSHKAFEINLFQLLSGGSCSSISHCNRVRKIDFDGSIDLNSSFEPEVVSHNTC